MEEKNSREKFIKYCNINRLFFDKKYDQVIKLTTNYLEKYGNNQKILYIRAYSFKGLKQYDKAIEDFKNNINLIEISEDYYLISKTYMELYFTYYKLNMYEEAYKLIDKIKDKYGEFEQIEIKNFEISEMIIKNKLGIEQPLTYKYKYGYILSQLYNYNENDALLHVKYNHIESNEKSSFSNKININYLYEYIKNNLNKFEVVNINSGLDAYFFSIANLGVDYSLNTVCNDLKVLVLPGTNKIVTMYPVICKTNKCYQLDLDYDKLFSKEKVKIKTSKQIDKFNKKYSRF